MKKEHGKIDWMITLVPLAIVIALCEKENVETPEYVTVSVNDEFVERVDFEKALKDGDEVEFLYFMGGGR